MVGVRADVVSRALASLLALGSTEALEHGGLGVVRVAELVGGDKGQSSRLLKRLAETGLVERDAGTGDYRLGWQLFALAARAGDRRLLEAAKPVLARLVRQLGERASLSVLSGAEVLTVFSESPPRTVQTVDWVGRTVPAYCTSSGRALMFDCRPDDLAVLFAGTQFRPMGLNPPHDVDELYKRVVASRARGFAMVVEEFETGLVAVAAPARDFRRRVCAAINVSGPKFRLGGRGRLEAAGQAVKEAADELSALLGEPAASAAADGNGGRS